jgi:hypothetical protein
LKVVLSVGGWTYSQSGHFAFVTDVTKRAAFVSSAVTIVENYGFDGMCVIAQLLHRALRGMLTKGCSDFDFEYPSSTTQGQGFANLITELRTAFTALQARKGDTTPYSISVRIHAFISLPSLNGTSGGSRGERRELRLHRRPADGRRADTLEPYVGVCPSTPRLGD